MRLSSDVAHTEGSPPRTPGVWSQRGSGTVGKTHRGCETHGGGGGGSGSECSASTHGSATQEGGTVREASSKVRQKRPASSDHLP
jgi:hypothetical protein